MYLPILCASDQDDTLNEAPTMDRRSRLRALCGSTGLALAGIVGSLVLPPAASAQNLPTNGVVVVGDASVTGNGNTMTINQSSQNAAINWQTFNIAPDHKVQFVQPNSSSVALNRVIGADASAILGELTANGQIFLINPNGILFGRGAQVNVAGLVASTLGMTDADFSAGRYGFAGAGPGEVVNQGSINADGGYVALLGASVSNQGLVQANMGTVALAATIVLGGCNDMDRTDPDGRRWPG